MVGCRPKQRHAAGAGDLEKLPLELRQMIYQYVLTDAETVLLDAYRTRSEQHYVIKGVESSRPARPEAAPYKHKRNSKHRGQEWKGKNWVEIANHKNALVLVNKQVHAEASAVLYGYNIFEFVRIRALECFLFQIGDVNKQYLRNINLFLRHTDPGSRSSNMIWGTHTRVLGLLVGAKNIRTITVNCQPAAQYDIMALRDGRTDQEVLELHVEACLPLLEELQDHFADNNINANVLDVLKVESHIVCRGCGKDEKGCHRCMPYRRRMARCRAMLKIMVIGELQPSSSEALQQYIGDLERAGGSWEEFVEDTYIEHFQPSIKQESD